MFQLGAHVVLGIGPCGRARGALYTLCVRLDFRYLFFAAANTRAFTAPVGKPRTDVARGEQLRYFC